MRPPPLPRQLDVLSGVLAAIEHWDGVRPPAVVFDLDATLFDTRPRTLEILLEYGELVGEGAPELGVALAGLELDSICPLLTDTLKACGIFRGDLVTEIAGYWHERFYSDDYLACDLVRTGAPAFARFCHDLGAVIVYVAGRDVAGMLLGTVAKLRDEGFPIGVAGVELVLKPDPGMSDESFKRSVLPSLDRVGDVVAVFDHELPSANLARALFPRATVVLVESQRGPGSPPPVEGLQVVADFRID